MIQRMQMNEDSYHQIGSFLNIFMKKDGFRWFCSIFMKNREIPDQVWRRLPGVDDHHRSHQQSRISTHPGAGEETQGSSEKSDRSCREDDGKMMGR